MTMGIWQILLQLFWVGYVKRRRGVYDTKERETDGWAGSRGNMYDEPWLEILIPGGHSVTAKREVVLPSPSPY